jgi:glycerol uptake facilitator-like aquaporin
MSDVAEPDASLEPPLEAFGLAHRLAAEALGTALLLAMIGSGIMGQRLAGGNDAIALLGNSLATGACLVVLITIFGPISGAHFNPAVTLARTLSDTFAGIAPASAPLFIGGQLLGAAAAVALFGWLLAARRIP